MLRFIVGFAGLEVRYFLGYNELPEVICTGKDLPSDIEITSMKLFLTSDNNIIGIVFPSSSTCYSYSQYLSCELHPGDSRSSVIRTLVPYLGAGEAIQLSCNITTLTKEARSKIYSWTAGVLRESKWSWMTSVKWDM